MDLAPPYRMDPDSLDLQQVSVLSIDQIRTIRANNDYVDRPAALELCPQMGPTPPVRDERPGLVPRSQSHPHHCYPSHMSRSSTVSSVSRGSATSDQRLLPSLASSHSGLAVRTQPDSGLKSREGLGKVPSVGGDLGSHLFICEHCGKCKCPECSSPRRLPSCWACGQRCLCSAEAAVEHGTCLCCIKGLFYHCSADDEDNCADRPCSCGPAHACARWGTMALLSLCLPCLCCYPPSKLCLALCQHGYDRATRPGCRCSNTNTVCRKISSSNPTTFPKSLEKPV
ncbi:protein sprouty homolog 3 [Brienomyrus brachyistius]|uniref:protein sprouty homolog 3 n=1 Tax=Brienomyrus brachyistius TaxID=42636 RepID=UPI0020B2D291|nr:protein sprouty homolog 3 [Brienomyrus brachyistius]XP_048861647.1 protein sprouty homolog 3 [Brienomyrus brachyistius]XP_048861648.1 protein sprouty homolog 3 [Brienomyrus brachyistius]